MIITEVYEINGKSFTKTYSNEHRYVVREGIEYMEANDPTELGRTYTEGNVMEDYSDDIDDNEAMNILLGGF